MLIVEIVKVGYDLPESIRKAQLAQTKRDRGHLLHPLPRPFPKLVGRGQRRDQAAAALTQTLAHLPRNQNFPALRPRAVGEK